MLYWLVLVRVYIKQTYLALHHYRRERLFYVIVIINNRKLRNSTPYRPIFVNYVIHIISGRFRHFHTFHIVISYSSEHCTSIEMLRNHLLSHAAITLAPRYPLLELRVNQISFNRVVYLLCHKCTTYSMHTAFFFAW